MIKIKIKRVNTGLRMMCCCECGKMAKTDDLFKIKYDATYSDSSLSVIICTDCLVKLHNLIEDALDTDKVIY